MTDVSEATIGTPDPLMVRIAILARDRVADLALPATVPLREILPAVQRVLPADDAESEGEANSAPRLLSLAPIGGVPFSLDASLDTVGVVDGDLLMLRPVPEGPASPGVVEDIADAAVIFSESRLRSWGINHIRRFAGTALVLLIIAATALAASYRVGTGGVVGLYGVIGLAVLTVIAALAMRSHSARAASELSVVALVPIVAACAVAVPGTFGPAQVTLAGAAVAAWSLISVILGSRGLILLTALTVSAVAVTAVGILAEVWNLSILTLGCGLLVVALLVTVQAAPLSALWARLPLPVIPAPGDQAPPAPPIRVLQDLPRRIRMSDSYQTGFLAGAVILSILGSLAIVWKPESVGAWAWYTVVAVSASALLRARVWNGAACKAWLLAQPFLVSTSMLVLFIGQGRFAAGAVVLAALLVLTAGFVTLAVNPDLAAPQSYSLPARRILGLLAAAVDASLVPVLAYLVGLFSWVLNR
ncbi:type VII secretion integral membrane protein EccD [Mycolicibacterium sp. Y3]